MALVESAMPNAFALGRSQETATVCVTTALLNALAPEQLEGVLAHDLTHIINRDVMVLTGRPSALSCALLVLNERMGSIPSKDLRTATQMNAFFIIPTRQRQWLRGLLATHPPIEKRVAALARYEEQLQRAQ